PRKYFPVMFQSGDYSHDGHSHIQGQKIAHDGSTHGMVWDYDIDIPLLFYGPAFVNAGKVIEAPATQQDLVPTYAQLMGALPPRGALHGRFLHQAFQPISKPPKAILTVVMDQGGWQYYRAHPDAWPY